MSDLNMCYVSMRITKEVKVKEQGNGAVISFCGAIHDDTKKDDSWITNTTFMDVLFYVKDSERFFFKKGDLVVLVNAKLTSFRNILRHQGKFPSSQSEPFSLQRQSHMF